MPGSTNLELPGSTNLELPGSTNLELPSSTNLELPGSTNLELSGSMNLELSGSTNSGRIGLTNNLTNPESSEFDNNVNVNNNQIIQHKMNKLTLHEGDFFNNWNEVQHAVDAYSKQHGFVAIKYRKDLDPVNKSIIRRRDYICWKSGVNKPKKVEDICAHHDGVSGKTDCPWIVHFYFGKRATRITITSIVNEHNHLCDSDTIELAPKYLQFPQEILDKIKSYTIVGRLGAAKSKLHGDAVKNFVNDFYRMRNSFTQEQFELKYNHMLEKYEPCRSYLETKLYPCRESWAKYAILKLFTAGAESTQRVESINGVLKKHVDRGTLLKELVKVIDQELEKEASYNRIRDYYGSNPLSGLPSTHNTIFNAIDSVLVEHLVPIPLSLQRAQMSQALLYQGILVTIEQASVKEFDIEADDAIEHLFDVPQIQLKNLLLEISNNEVQEIWNVFYITMTSSKSHYVVILKDSTLLCTSVFHLELIHTRWFKSIPANMTEHVTISEGIKSFTSTPLYHIGRIRTANVYTPTIKENVNKKHQFGTTMSIAKTSVQVAVTEGVFAELIGILTQFITKYRNNTGLGIQEIRSLQNENENIHIESNNRQPLTNLDSSCTINEISNPEYHKPRGRPPKRLKSSNEENKENAKQHSNHEQRTCSYCSVKGHNIRGCAQYKADIVDKENH
ncbi:2188_t:CDS:2 [Cetraspora pellucida]|uniref:2188_t:CDS:1 n=1 Tax=Cetraspora pellucida TaxID=1433469 RepID=A0ACA9LIT7_9GLOM|nr:2188_t:CDS:2 [Cetraspora pellucida]